MTTSGLPIYLDYGATTPVDPRVLEAMLPWLGARFGNPSSGHTWGWEAERAVEAARGQVADLVGADPREIVWTSGATESNNLALKGAAQARQAQGRHLITLKTEHKAVLDSLHALERQGFEVSYLDVCEDGLLDLEQFQAAIRPDTILASVMHVNNEIGVVQGIAAIGALCRERGVWLHVDAAQSTGKLPIDLRALPVDLMSFTAHKTYGPKGIGALYLRRQPRVQVQAQLHGGGQELGVRPGTLPTHQIVGMGEAFRLAGAELAQDNARMRALRARLLDGLQSVPGLFLNGHPTQRVPHNINLGFDDLGGEALITGLDGLAVSSGSACNSASMEPSHVLRALGRSDEQAHASLRITLGRFSTAEEVDQAVRAIRDRVASLRGFDPVAAAPAMA